MEIFWIQKTDETTINLATGKPARLYHDPADAVNTLTRMQIDEKYTGRVLLVRGKSDGKDIYHCTILGVLAPYE